MRGDSIYRHREEPRLELCTPENEALPIPLKYVAVMRRTRSTVDNVSENVIHDIWPEAEDVNLSEDWTRTARFQILRTRFEGYIWVSGRPAKVQKITKPDSLWSKSLDAVVQEQQQKEIADWAAENAKLQGSTPQRKSTRYRSIARITTR